MQYKIEGGAFPAVICRLESNEAVDCQKGAMSWMSANMSMATGTGGGLGKMFGRALFGGEGLFNTKITGPGHIWVQTMPMIKLAGSVAPYIMSK
jgi:uncharacterized protein (AIM24 family)